MGKLRILLGGFLYNSNLLLHFDLLNPGNHHLVLLLYHSIHFNLPLLYLFDDDRIFNNIFDDHLLVYSLLNRLFDDNLTDHVFLDDIGVLGGIELGDFDLDDFVLSDWPFFPDFAGDGHLLDPLNNLGLLSFDQRPLSVRLLYLDPGIHKIWDVDQPLPLYDLVLVDWHLHLPFYHIFHVVRLVNELIHSHLFDYFFCHFVSDWFVDYVFSVDWNFDDVFYFLVDDFFDWDLD